MKRFSVWLVLAALVFGLAACGSDGGDEGGGGEATAAEEGPITLGFAIGEGGFMVPYDVPTRTVAQMAVDDINANGGVNGRQLEIVSANTKSKPELAGNAATKVIEDGADIVVTSCDFDQGSPAAIVAQQEGLLAFSTCAASTSFGPTGIGPLAFTMATAAPAEGATMADWAYEDKGWKRAFSLLDDTIDFTKQTTFGFKERFEQLGGEIVGDETFKQEDQSIASQINAIKSVSPPPDVIWLTSYNPGLASAIKQIRAAGIDIPIIGDEDMDGDYWKEAVPNVSDIYYATYGSIYGDDSNQAINDLVSRYRKQEGSIPDTSLFLTGYAMVEAIATAIERAGGSTDGASLQAELEKFKNEDFLLPTTFTPEQHISFERTLRILEIQDGKSSLVTEYKPKEVPVP